MLEVLNRRDGAEEKLAVVVAEGNEKPEADEELGCVQEHGGLVARLKASKRAGKPGKGIRSCVGLHEV